MTPPKTPQTLDKAAVKGVLRAHRAELRGFGVARLGLFGSALRGEAGPESDVDLLVEFEGGKKGFAAFMALAFCPQDTLQRPVELVTPESLSPYLAPHILPTVEVVFGPDDRAACGGLLGTASTQKGAGGVPNPPNPP